MDTSQAAKFVTDRSPLYAAGEEAMLDEWLERSAHGERMPEGWAI